MLTFSSPEVSIEGIVGGKLEVSLITLPVLVIIASLVFFSGFKMHTYIFGRKRQQSTTDAFSETERQIVAVLKKVSVVDRYRVMKANQITHVV